ncbi:MAG: hypothetical protein WD898_03765 [Candidatus Paceibacterota bacterium]
MKQISKPPAVFLSYRNERVVKRYMKDHQTDEITAEKVFSEMLKFLYLCTVISTPCSPPSREVDDMWHIFILHTPDYFRFCAENVGRYMHHDPTEQPYTGNRPEMLEVAQSIFGDLDVDLWKHLLSPVLEAGRKDYCIEQCNGGGCTNKIFESEMQAPAQISASVH